MLKGFVPVATVGDLADGQLAWVTAEDEEIVLLRIGARYFAVGAMCTHAFGMLDQGTLRGYELECPIHEGRFDVRTGQPTREPAEVPIETYAVRVEGDQVLVGPPDM